MKQKVAPTVKVDGDRITETHPAYGMISLGRYQGGQAHLFGSSIVHHGGVFLSISSAARVRNLNQNWYHECKEIIRVEMSEAQFAQIITSLNTSGTPVTLRRVNGCPVPDCEEVNERKKIEGEFNHTMAELAAQLTDFVKTADELAMKATVNKADRVQFAKTAKSIKAQVENVVPFIQSQFNEAMDNVVTEAKAEVDSFANQLIKQLGVEALNKELRDRTDVASKSLEIESKQTHEPEPIQPNI